ncbi:4'-phosphopantetheinyl transferase superfamily protein [Streptomyces rubradiris]|uniref:4'-phosphopantetheinyl transferase family protein n=1 Tax=Streptomyces rubradiris TaxID=285531 RepID=UPI003401E794
MAGLRRVVTGRQRHDVLVVCATFTEVMPLQHLLTAEESTYARGLAARRARDFTAGRTLLRWVLRRELGEEGRHARIGRTGRGKPVLEGRESTGISISHSGETVAVALAHGRAVGVDVQVPIPPTDGLVAALCCSRTQARELAALRAERQATALARRWAVHEACAKATGRGLVRRPETYAGPLWADRGHGRGLGWNVLPPFGDCALAVAFDRPDPFPAVGLVVLSHELCTGGAPGNRTTQKEALSHHGG